MIHRRVLMLSCLVGTVAALAGCQTTPPLAAGTPIAAVHVDVSRLVAFGAGPNAGTIKAILERDLGRSLAPDGRRGGATVTVTVRSMTMSDFAGSAADDGVASDYLDSIVSVTGTDGRVLATIPVHSSNGSGDAGAWFDPDLAPKRIDLLARNHALWIARMVRGRV